MFDNYQEQREKAEDLTFIKVYRYDGVKGPCAMIFKPKAVKPYARYYFPTEEAREAYISKQLNIYMGRSAQMNERKQARKGTDEQINSIPVGAIFHHSWGYEQTNADFYQVIEKQGRSLILREINTRTVRPEKDLSMSSTITAVKDDFKANPSFKKLLQFTGEGKPYIRICSCGWCGLWDGQPTYISWYA